MITLDTPVENIPRINQKYTKLLNKIGIKTARDFLFHLPFRYDDYSKSVPISEVAPEELLTVQGEITSAKTIRTWKRKMFITEIALQDSSGSIQSVWFNQPYLSDSLQTGKEIRISGKATNEKNKLIFSNPSWELASRIPTNTGILVPIYPETGGLTSKWLRWQIQNLLKSGLELEDSIPETIVKKFNLPTLDKSIHYIHFPKSENQYLVARKRFAFEEMFLVQLKALQVKYLWDKEKSVKIKFDKKLIEDFISSLPFQLTGAQKKSSIEISKDLDKEHPMNRLLNGDVGSGKTIVAAIACLQTMQSGYQSALMAPTEVLALQHFETIKKLFSGRNFNIALLTNSYKFLNNKKTTRPYLIKKIKSGEVNLIVGTHALIQRDIRFKNLSLIIVDEQHRFGVEQRAYLQQEAAKINDGIPQKIPHFLTMTATPIPRTLTLAFFGNLDLSVLDEMPAKRKKIITEIVDPKQRSKTYAFIREEIKSGRQCFVILPLVEESKVLTEVKAATKEHERLSKEFFPDLAVGLIHGRLKAAEKEAVMDKFSKKEIDILVATAVVEVGIDIPNATTMIIEDADRFGLSQLHQFRGRIGRGEHQSYCYLFTASSSARAKSRLKALVESENGFKIAEKDLEIRGPGEFFGTRQSGIPDIAMENITNIKLIQAAREEAQNILKKDPQLKNHLLLQDSLKKFGEKIHLE